MKKTRVEGEEEEMIGIEKEVFREIEKEIIREINEELEAEAEEEARIGVVGEKISEGEIINMKEGEEVEIEEGEADLILLLPPPVHPSQVKVNLDLHQVPQNDQE